MVKYSATPMCEALTGLILIAGLILSLMLMKPLFTSMQTERYNYDISNNYGPYNCRGFGEDGLPRTRA